MKEHLAPMATSLLVLVAVGLGPAVGKVIEFHLSRDAKIQYIGGEYVTAAAALAIFAGVVAPQSIGWVCAQTGASAYVLYTMVTVVFGQEHARYPGNSEHYFLLFVGISIGAILTVAQGVSLLLRSAAVPANTTARTTLVVVAIAFAALWLQAIAANYASPTAEYVDSPALFWLIKYLDLAVIVPTALVCALHWGSTHRVGGVVILAFGFWMMAAISAMQVAMIVMADAPVSMASVAVVMTAGALWCATVVLRWPMSLDHVSALSP